MSEPHSRIFLLFAAIALAIIAAAYYLRTHPDEIETAPPTPITSTIRSAVITPPPPTDFTTLDLQSALISSCTESAAESPGNDLTQEEFDARGEAIKEEMLEISERLSASANAEHFHFAAMLDEDPVSRIEMLDRAISNNSTDPFLLWAAVQICSEVERLIEQQPELACE